MRTENDADATVLSLLDYTTPSLFDLSSDEDLSPTYERVPPEFSWAPAWSESALGDPDDDDTFVAAIDDYGPEAAPAASRLAVAAVALGALGVGALLGIAALDFARSPSVLPTVAVAAQQLPPAQASMSPAPGTTALPHPGTVPASTLVPAPSQHATVRVLPCNPMPYCI